MHTSVLYDVINILTELYYIIDTSYHLLLIDPFFISFSFIHNSQHVYVLICICACMSADTRVAIKIIYKSRKLK